MVPTFNTKLSCLSLWFFRLRMSPFTSCFQCNVHQAWYGLAPPYNQRKGGSIMSMKLTTLVLCMWHQLTTWKKRRMSCWRTTTVTTYRKPAMQKKHLVLCTSSKNSRLCLAFTVLQQLERTERLLCSTETLAKICTLLPYIQLYINTILMVGPVSVLHALIYTTFYIKCKIGTGISLPYWELLKRKFRWNGGTEFPYTNQLDWLISHCIQQIWGQERKWFEVQIEGKPSHHYYNWGNLSSCPPVMISLPPNESMLNFVTNPAYLFWDIYQT